jgi:hypothetical protein
MGWLVRARRATARGRQQGRLCTARQLAVPCAALVAGARTPRPVAQQHSGDDACNRQRQPRRPPPRALLTHHHVCAPAAAPLPLLVPHTPQQDAVQQRSTGDEHKVCLRAGGLCAVCACRAAASSLVNWSCPCSCTPPRPFSYLEQRHMHHTAAPSSSCTTLLCHTPHTFVKQRHHTYPTAAPAGLQAGAQQAPVSVPQLCNVLLIPFTHHWCAPQQRRNRQQATANGNSQRQCVAAERGGPAQPPRLSQTRCP